MYPCIDRIAKWIVDWGLILVNFITFKKYIISVPFGAMCCKHTIKLIDVHIEYNPKYTVRWCSLWKQTMVLSHVI